MRRHGEYRPLQCRQTIEADAIALAQEYLDIHYAQNISLEEWAAVVQLKPLRLLRAFPKKSGTSAASLPDPNASRTGKNVAVPRTGDRRYRLWNGTYRSKPLQPSLQTSSWCSARTVCLWTSLSMVWAIRSPYFRKKPLPRLLRLTSALNDTLDAAKRGFGVWVAQTLCCWFLQQQPNDL